jgi:CheY-like chemotaxis protein
LSNASQAALADDDYANYIKHISQKFHCGRESNQSSYSGSTGFSFPSGFIFGIAFSRPVCEPCVTTKTPVQNRGKILVVEDEPQSADNLRERLTRLGYTVVGVAPSGTEAIQKTDELRPDLALIDTELKGILDGIAAAEQIRAGFQIPVVYVTANSDDYTMQRAKVTDPVGYLFRPFEDRELEITIEMAFYKHTMEQEREALIRDLQEAISEVRKLSGLLPICLACKKIRDDRGYWNRVEEYISKYSRAKFTHGYCPDCARKFMQGFRGGIELPGT